MAEHFPHVGVGMTLRGNAECLDNGNPSFKKCRKLAREVCYFFALDCAKARPAFFLNAGGRYALAMQEQFDLVSILGSGLALCDCTVAVFTHPIEQSVFHGLATRS